MYLKRPFIKVNHALKTYHVEEKHCEIEDKGNDVKDEAFLSPLLAVIQLN